MSTAVAARPRFKRPVYLVYNPMDTGKDYTGVDRNYHWDAMDSCEIHDALTWPKDDDNRIITGGRREILSDARAVAELLCSEEHLGPLGFVILEGSEGEQQEVMRQARRQWIGVRTVEIEQIIDGWEHHVAAVTSGRPGAVPPRPSKRVARAYDDRGKFAAYGDGEERKAFVCEFCGLDFEVSADLRSHALLNHPAVVKPEADEVPTKERKGPDINKGKAVLAAAKDSKVKLSVADRKGLQFGDQDVISDVEARIDAEEGVADDRDSGVDMSPEPASVPGPTGPKAKPAGAKTK